MKNAWKHYMIINCIEILPLWIIKKFQIFVKNWAQTVNIITVNIRIYITRMCVGINSQLIWLYLFKLPKSLFVFHLNLLVYKLKLKVKGRLKKIV